MLVWPDKDPDENVLCTVDWLDRLKGDAISATTFTVSSGDVTVSGGEHDGNTMSQVLVSGGTANTKAKVLCEITTEDGQTLQQTATLLIRAR
jgi:hypothetical protein